MAKKKATKNTKQLELNKVVAGVFLATAVVAFPLGYLTSSSMDSSTETTENTSEQSVDDSSETETTDAHMHSNQYEITYAHDIPAVTDFTVVKDAHSGWNLHIEIDNFEFTPENASSDHVDREGHAHIYVDGEKIGRLYGNDYHLPNLGEGEHAIKVTVNTNDHKDYALSGDPLQAETTVIEVMSSMDSMEQNDTSMDMDDAHDSMTDHDTTEHSH